MNKAKRLKWALCARSFYFWKEMIIELMRTIAEFEYENDMLERIEEYEELLYEIGYYEPDPCERQFMEAARNAREDS